MSLCYSWSRQSSILSEFKHAGSGHILIKRKVVTCHKHDVGIAVFVSIAVGRVRMPAIFSLLLGIFNGNIVL